MEQYPTDERFDRDQFGDPGDNGLGAAAASINRGVRLRIGLGAGVVLVLIAAAIAVVISAVASHPAAAATTDAAAASGGSSGSSSYGSGATAPAAPAAAAASGSTGASTTALVQVVGQVVKPGLYELPAGDRVIDAIAAAGGFTSKADQASLNLAQVIADGQQIVVAKHGSASSVGVAATGSVAGGAGAIAIVDINTADLTALETLDGIGPALAQRILSYRTAHNGFRSVGDLQNVTGIGPKKYAAIKASVSV